MNCFASLFHDGLSPIGWIGLSDSATACSWKDRSAGGGAFGAHDAHRHARTAQKTRIAGIAAYVAAGRAICTICLPLSNVRLATFEDLNMPATGKITQVIGSTFDAEFPEEALPAIYNAVKIDS